MSIIVANIPLVVPVPAGFRLQFGTPISGSCVVTLPDRILTETLTDGEGLGPYQSDASVSITSTVPGTCWTIRRDGPTVTLQAAHLAQAPYMPGVSVFIGESASGPATPAGWSGTQFQALVSGGGIADNPGTTLFLATDSILAQSFRPPSSTFGATSAKGSYVNGSTRTVGVTNLYAENPVRLKFRAAHNLVTGDQVYLDEFPSAHPLAQRRATVTVVAADEVTLDGIDGTSVATITSAGAATDGLAMVDMAHGNGGALSWALVEMGFPFARIDGCMRPGATSAQLAAQIGAALTGRYNFGLLNVGRNDVAYNEASQVALRDALLASCDYVIVVLPYPDGTSGGYTAGSLAKLKSLGEFWYAQQAANPRLKICDMFSVVSDPTAALEAAFSYMLSDSVHPTATGAAIMGPEIAASWPEVSGPRSVASRVSAGSANILASGRFTAATGGTLSSGATGNIAAGWTFAASSGNVTGGYVQVINTPAMVRRNSTAYAAGDILDIGDGWWYVVKTAGNSAAAEPAGYATAVKFDSAGFADGTVTAFRIPKFTTSTERLSWQYMDIRVSADGGAEAGVFSQASVALPGTVAVGDFVRGEMLVAQLGGFVKATVVQATLTSSAPAQLARAHGLGVTGLLSRAVSQEIKPKKIRTPAIRVPANTATMGLRTLSYVGIEGGVVVVSQPLLEKVAAPGLIA